MKRAGKYPTIDPTQRGVFGRIIEAAGELRASRRAEQHVAAIVARQRAAEWAAVRRKVDEETEIAA